MKSKFTYRAYLTLLAPVFFLIIFTWKLTIFSSVFGNNPILGVLFPIALLFSLIIAIFGEIRTKAISVEFAEDQIIVKRFWGLSKEFYRFSEMEGWKCSHVRERNGNRNYEYLYLYKNGKKVVKLSDYYHKNFLQLKEIVKSKVKYIGYENYSFMDEVKEVFK